MKNKAHKTTDLKYWSKKKLSEWGFCTSHTAKMKHIISLSTSPLMNALCQIRCKIEDFICSKCFSIAQQKLYTNLSKKLARNTEKLTKLIPYDELPIINPGVFPMLRFESFGDLNNKEQAMNYINIAIKNPKIRCAMWTKNPLLVRAALKELGITKEMGIPRNLTIVLSSPKMNTKIESSFWFITHIFTVYDKEYVKENDIYINCGAKSCWTCRRCYYKEEGGVVEVREQLKKR